MAVKKKIKSNKKLNKASNNDVVSTLSGMLFLLLMILGVYFIVRYLQSNNLEIKEGDCFIDRIYEPIVVAQVYPNLEEVHFRDAKVLQLGDGRVLLSSDPTTLRLRTFSFIKENYTKVKCYHE